MEDTTENVTDAVDAIKDAMKDDSGATKESDTTKDVNESDVVDPTGIADAKGSDKEDAIHPGNNTRCQ